MQPDRGYRDPDNSPDFDAMLASLDHFQRTDYVRAARRTTHRLLRPRPGMRLLDAGCGTGIDVALLATRVQPGGVVVGLDFSDRFLQTARARHGAIVGVEFGSADIRSIPYPDRHFDGAFALRVVRYLDDFSEAAAELARVVRPGGRVIICEGGMSAIDLPDSPLTRRAFWPVWPAPGARLPLAMKRADLTDITVHPAFGASIGDVDPKVLEYAREVSREAVEAGEVEKEEAGAWIRRLEELAANGEWFSADCMFVVAGTVA